MIPSHPLRVFADRTMQADWAYIPLLYPIWGLQVKDTTPYLAIAYTQHGWDPASFTVVDNPIAAEYIVVAHEYWWMKKNRPDLLNAYVTLSRQHNVPLLVDATSDSAGTVALPNARILRTNQYRSFLPRDEITTPYAVEDLLESYCAGTFVPREKTSTPSIGFAGFARLTLTQYIRTVVNELPDRLRSIFDRRYSSHRRGIFWRARAMKIFSHSREVRSDFLTRSSYSGHVKTVAGDMQKNRRQFVDNLLNNDYALVVRGDPNASQRLYEALSLGRIPVVLDTDCVFPLEHLIDYREFCVIIDYKDLKRAPEILADFHRALSPEKYRRMQYRARDVYEKYLRIDSFSKYLVAMLRESRSVVR